MISPILLQLGPFTIRWYGVTATLGMLAGFWYVQKVRQWLKLPLITDGMFVWLIIWGVIGARLYHVLNELPFYLAHPAKIPAIWNGGLAIHGGIIAGALVLYYYARKYKISFWRFADVFMPAALLGQAIGRWGNFFNQELFGKPTSLFWGIFIEPQYRPNGFESFSHFHPTFLYQFLWNILAVIALTLLIKKNPQQTPGKIFSLALILWGMGRFLIELMRIDQTPVIGGFRLPLLFSALMVIVGILLYYRLNTKKATTS